MIFAGLRPGLLAKWQSARTAPEKFEFLKAFILDPTNLGSVEVEAHYKEVEQQKNEAKWVEMPLHELRDKYKTPELQRFLKTKVLDVQEGRCHPQDPTGENPEMRLYWVYVETSDCSGKSKEVGTGVRVRANLPENKAAITALADGLVGSAADFGGKGAPKDNPPKTRKGRRKGKRKRKREGQGGGSLCIYMLYSFVNFMFAKLL